MSRKLHAHEHKHEHDHAQHQVEYVVHQCDGQGHQHHHHTDGSCCCEQHASEFHGIDKPMLVRLIASALFYLAGMFVPMNETAALVLFIFSAIASGYDIVQSAVKNLMSARIFDEYFLMSFAAIAAFAIGEAEEGAAVFLLYRIGAFCQSYAIRHSRSTIATLTGESVVSADNEKVSNRFITGFARIYTPVILAMAVMIAVLLPILKDYSVRDSVYRALTFLVVACPCAIVISVPLTYFAGIGAASKSGIFFRNSEVLDDVAANKLACPELERIELNGQPVYRCAFCKTDSDAAELVMLEESGYENAVRIAVGTCRIAHENVWFTILIKVSVLILSVFGISALWFAVFADSGVTVIAVLNSLRAFRPVKKEKDAVE